MKTLSPTPAELSDLLAGAMAGKHTVVLPAAKDGRVHVLSPEAFVPCAERPDDAPPALVVFTSGSTGTPKGVALSAAALQASGRATERWLGGPGTWYLPLAPHHIAGAQVLLRSRMAGTTPLVSLGHFSAAGFTDDVNRLAARVHDAESLPDTDEQTTTTGEAAPASSPSRLYASLVPTQLVRILRDPDATKAAARFDAILLGGASVAPSVMAAAQAAGIHLVRTYGMSETGGGCVYNGVPFDEVTMSIDSAGRVVLSGAVLADGYVDFDSADGQLRARPDCDSGFGYAGSTGDAGSAGDAGGTVVSEVSPAARRFTTSDLGRITDGVLDVLGRADDVIVVGAENIAPLAVENALLQALEPTGVSEVLVTSVPDPEWGSTLVALLSADSGPFAGRGQSAATASPVEEGQARDTNATAAALAARVRELLPADGTFPGIWRPRFVLPVDAIPAKGIGKPDRRAARAMAQAALGSEYH